MPIPDTPKIYHIVHFDRLPSIISDGGLWCDAKILALRRPGTTIGMTSIKRRRLELRLTSRPGLNVGSCVPFYFCPRSVMLYLIHKRNSELAFQGGQGPIVHLEADLNESVAWAENNAMRWAFTLSNAGAIYFEDRCDLAGLDRINWDAVRARNWAGPGVPPSVKEGKQAEFLMERFFPLELISRVGVRSLQVYGWVCTLFRTAPQNPRVEIKPNWYY